MLFAMGVAIFIICFSVFRIYEDYFTEMTIRDQLDNVKNFVTSNILRLCRKGGNVNSTIILKMPRTIVNEVYQISLSDSGINITSLASKISVSSDLYGLTESFEFSGTALSSYGNYIIYKKENRIIIE